MSGAGETLAATLADAGLPEDAVVEVGPPSADAPPPPEGPWVVLPFDDTFVVGGFSRGAFRAYGTVPSREEARALAVRLAATEPPLRPVGDVGELADRGHATARAIRERALERSGRPGPAQVSAGAALDLIGPDSAHHLYALATPFPERAQPPTDVGAEYHRYLVVEQLPEAREGLASPWFGQPGGGAMVVLDRPVRWYVDQGMLAELRDPTTA
jgi:Tuberculosis necrotizing toxin